jgi:hypothetical protein
LELPCLFAQELQKRLRLRTFIDTGTWEGLTALWAVEHFDRVHTIEIDGGRYAASFQKFEEKAVLDKVVAHLGDSRRILEKLIPYVDPTTFFWLGARTEDDCPLLDELALIRGGSDKHIIMVDDMKRFSEGTFESWPTFDEICRKLAGLAFFLEGDVLVAFPHEYTSVVVDVLHKVRGE